MRIPAAAAALHPRRTRERKSRAQHERTKTKMKERKGKHPQQQHHYSMRRGPLPAHLDPRAGAFNAQQLPQDPLPRDLPKDRLPSLPGQDGDRRGGPTVPNPLGR